MSEFVPETYKLDERNDRIAFLENYKGEEMFTFLHIDTREASYSV